MSDTELTRISTLLARRDGEPRDAAKQALSGEDAADLALLEELKGAVQALPDVPVSDAWRRHLPPELTSRSAPAPAEQRSDNVVSPPSKKAWRWHRYPMASAAAAFVVSVAAVLLIDTAMDTAPAGALPEPGYAVTGAAAAPSGGQAQLVALMNRSRDLEQRIYGLGSWQVNATAQVPDTSLEVSRLGQFILYQLAEVDAQIAALHELDTMDDARRLALWQRRVSLLRAFATDMASTHPDAQQSLRSM